jgi:predicted nucleic acid-binding Zn ribbon protein
MLDRGAGFVRQGTNALAVSGSMRYNDSGQMERASTLLGKLASRAAIDPEELACKAWPMAVGKKVAVHTRAARMVRTRLIIEVEDAVWKRQLLALSGQIVSNLAKHLGPGIVEDLEFRVMPPRREPQRAPVAKPSVAPLDEADQIHDPVLRGIYRNARKKALA